MNNPTIIGNATLSDCLKLYPCIGNVHGWPDPEPRHFDDPCFDKIWEAIKAWDIDYGNGRSGATGNHVRAILDALDT